MSRNSKTLQAAHLPYWFRQFSLRVSCSVIIISTALSPLASFVNAAESNIHGNQNNTPFITSDISSSSSISPMSDTVRSFNFPPAPGPIPTQSPTSTPIITEKTDSQDDSNSSDQLNLDELVFAEQKIKAALEPAIFLPGKPFTLSWKLPDWTLLEKGETRHMLITFPDGIEGTTLLKEKELIVPVETASGSVSFSIPNVVIEKMGEAAIYLQLFENDQPVGTTSILVGPPLGTFNNTQAKSIQAFNGKVKLTLPVFASASQLALDIRKPDENSLPSLSLTGKPVEVLAVDLDTGKNVKTFTKPITVEMIYDDEQIWDWQEDELKIFYFNEDTKDWHPLPTSVDTKTNTLTAQTNHFTVFDYKAETWQAASLPSIDSFQVSNFIGAGTYSMPFWTPPGPGGLQPSISLSYNSQVIDSSSLYTQASWVGTGWSLDTGAIIRHMHDTDDDTSDDTFYISVAGINSLLLPVEESSDVTIYRSTEETFNKIEFDQSAETWTVWTKTGMVYKFESKAKTHTTDGCVNPGGDLNIIWRWSLSSVTNIHGKTLDYSYHTETKSGCANEVAVYPESITYPHGLYRVHFVREARTDYKTAWGDNDSEVLYGTQRLKEVVIEHDPAGTSSWSAIRKYKFTYSDNTINQIYPAFTWSGGGKTLTLVEIQETSGDGLDTLPATSFYYEDDMHLTKVENGLGGNITLEYERWTYHDDVNDDLRSMRIVFGSNECTATLGTSWVAGPPDYGRMHCAGAHLEIGHLDDRGTGHHSIPEHIAHPGGLYHFYLRLCGDSGPTDGRWGFIKQDTKPYIFTNASFDNVGNNYQQVDLQETFEIPIDYDPSDTKLRIDCSDCRIYKMQFTLRPVYYRVISKTIQDLVTGRESTYTYQYDNPAPNDEYRSEAVAEAGQNIEDLYTYPMREYRGNQMAQVVDENHLAQTTWYYQNDIYKGSPYKTFTFRQDYWDPFTALNTADWTTSTAGTHEISSTYSVDYDKHLRMTNSASDWSVHLTRSTYSLANGEMAIGHIRIGNGTTRGSIRLLGSSTGFFGLEIIESNGEYKAVTRYDTGSGAHNGSTLIPLGDFKPDKWYGFMLFVDTDEGSGVRIWQLDDPTNAGEEILEGFSSYSWRFITYVIDGTLDLDAYQEGKPYSETNIEYEKEILYDTIANNGIDDLSDSNLLDFIDLKVVSTETTETSNRIYEGDYSWTGTESSYTYDNYGNITEVIEAGKNLDQLDYVDYRKTTTEYNPNNIAVYLVSLPARTRQYECLSGNCSTVELASSAWYLYDDASSYEATPLTGVLTGTRVLAESQDFIDQEFGYDSWGNLITLTHYKNLENYAAFGSSPSITSTTIYEDTYHTYPVTITNPLSQSITTVYDYALGLPTSVTDPNSVVTTGEYDDFGRITSVCYPGEDCTTTPNLQFIYHDSSYPFYTEVIQKINASRTFRISKYFSGLGELLQTQILNAEVNGISRDVLTNYLYDQFGNMIRESVPYDVSLGSGYRTPSWSDYTAFGYDLLNRRTSTTAPNGNSTHIYFDDLEVKVTDPRWKSTTSYQDVWGRTTKVVPPSGTDLELVTYEYDILGQLLELSQDTLTTEISYDQAGRKTDMDDPDMGSWSYTYDALGNLTSQKDARECITSLTYDDLNRLTGKNYSGLGYCETTPIVTYTYDQGTNGIGRRTGMADGSGVTSWNYDSRGRVTSETRAIDEESFITSWTYNSADMVASITYPDDEVVEFDYNNQKALIGMENTETTPFTYISDITYDSTGRLTGVDLGESGSQALIAREFEYFPWGTTQDGGMLQSLVSSQVGGATLQNLAYDYDPNGNILEITDYLNQEVSSYAYDNLNRLTSADVEDFSSQDVFEEYYEYESAIGNLTAKGSSPTILNDYVYDPGHPHAVSGYGNLNTYEYDENGNQITRQIDEDDYDLSYDAENRLISVSLAGISTSTLTSTPTITQTPTPEFTPTITYTPGNTPTPSPTGVPAYKLSTGYLSNVGSTWQTVTLSKTYTSMVVVASPNYDNSDSPAVVRIKNASGSSFEIKVQNPGDTTLSGYTVYYMVLEEGVYTEANDGVKMEAVKYTSTITDENNSWIGENRSYQQSYTSPVVLGQVMTENDADWSVFWSRGSSQHNPPDSSNLYTGKHVGEDTVTSRADETTGYIVIESGSGYFGQKAFVAALGSDTVAGVDNSPPYTYTLSGPSGATYAIVNQAGMDGSDGGWAVLHGSDPVSSTALDLACDEDQIANSERGHTTEQLGYLVIGEDQPITSAASLAASSAIKLASLNKTSSETLSQVVEASTSWNGGNQAFTCPAGTNLLIVGYGIGYSQNRPAAMTYNGVSMTLVEETINVGGYGSVAQLWILENPDTGSSYTIAPSISGGDLVAVAFSGANIGDLFSRIDEYTLDTDNDLNFAKSITSAEGELIIDVFSTYRGSNPVPDTTGQTLIENQDRMGMSKKAGASSVAMDWNSGTTRSSPSCWIIASMKEQTSPPTPTATPTKTATTTPTATLTDTPPPTITYTPSNTPTQTPTGTIYPTPTPSNTVPPYPTLTQTPNEPLTPAVEASTSWNGGNQAFTCPAGTNLLIVGYGIGYSQNRPAAMTYNGVSMTLLEETINTGGYGSVAQLWILENPDTGSSYTIAPSISGGDLVAVAFSGANIGDLFSQIDEYTLDTDDDQSFYRSITSAEGELIIDVFSTYRGSNPVPDTTGQTLIENQDRMGMSTKAGASSVAMDWISGTDRSSPSCWIIASMKVTIAPTPTLISTPTPTITSTPTLTYTPSATPSPTQTGTIDPTPTATDSQFEPPPDPLESAQYTYDGDGKLVKSVVNDVTTYYVGKIYEKEIDGEATKERKYYSLGGQRIAVRDDGVLNWMLSDHLGSTSISAHADGSWRGEIAYTPFGEMRVSRGMTLTDYRYTGQRLEAEVGLYFYQARWMDPVVGRFTQADTIITDPGNPLALDRYAYVNNNPVKYIDPTGHVLKEHAGGGGGVIDPPPLLPIPPALVKLLQEPGFYFGVVNNAIEQIDKKGIKPFVIGVVVPLLDDWQLGRIQFFGINKGAITRSIGRQVGSYHPAIQLIGWGITIFPEQRDNWKSNASIHEVKADLLVDSVGFIATELGGAALGLVTLAMTSSVNIELGLISGFGVAVTTEGFLSVMYDQYVTENNIRESYTNYYYAKSQYKETIKNQYPPQRPPVP